MIPPHEKRIWFKLKKLQAGDLLRPFARLWHTKRRRRLFQEAATPGKSRIVFSAYNRGFGDIIIYSYALAAFRQKHPEVHSSLLLKKKFIPFASRLALADEYLACEEREQADEALNAADYLVDLSVEADAEVGELFRRHKTALRLSFANHRQGLFSDYTIPFKREERLSARYFTLLTPFQVPLYSVQPEIQITQEERAHVDRVLAENGITDRADNYVVMAPGSRLTNLGMARRWPGERYAELAAFIRERLAIPVLITGAPDEAEYCADIITKSKADIKNVAGVFTYIEDAHFMSRAAFFVSNDSSPMHLAALAAVPGVHFVKNGVDPWRPDSFPPAPRKLLEFFSADEISVDAARQAVLDIAREAELHPD